VALSGGNATATIAELAAQEGRSETTIRRQIGQARLELW
jgi:hypothetical protein